MERKYFINPLNPLSVYYTQKLFITLTNVWYITILIDTVSRLIYMSDENSLILGSDEYKNVSVEVALRSSSVN